MECLVRKTLARFSMVPCNKLSNNWRYLTKFIEISKWDGKRGTSFITYYTNWCFSQISTVEEETVIDYPTPPQNLPQNLLSEIESALAKARIAYNKSKSKPTPKEKPSTSTRVENIGVKNRSITVPRNQPPKVSENPAVSACSGPRYKPAHTTAPFNTFCERSRNKRP